MEVNLYEILSHKGLPPLNEAKTKLIIHQMIKALDFVHAKGIFHRDIKPENILIKGAGANIHELSIPADIHRFPVIKLADFGSCRGVNSRMPYTEYIGTRWYRSPECLLFDGIYGKQ